MNCDQAQYYEGIYMIFIPVLWCFGSRYKANQMCDLYLEEVQRVKWYVSWELGFIFKGTREEV